MQAIIVEKPYRFVPPFRSTAFSWLVRRLGLHRWYLGAAEKVTSHELRRTEHFQASRRAGHSILIAANHCRTADPFSVGWAIADLRCHLTGPASWHLFQSPLQRFFLRALGAYSIHREGVDRASVNFTIDALVEGKRIVGIFPEGATSRINDRLGPLQEGVTLIARTAAKRLAKQSPARKVMVHPVAVKYFFQGDVEEAVDNTLTAIEARLSWPPQRHLPLVTRIEQAGSALLALKELQYFGAARSGALAERMARLIERLLGPHEAAHGVAEKIRSPAETLATALPRVRALRSKWVPELTTGALSAAERDERWKALADVYLAQQVAAFPPDYLCEYPSVDRLLEIVEKFEEDLTDKAHPHAPTKVVIEFGEGIEVSPERERGGNGDPLMTEIHKRLSGMLERLGRESPLYVPRRFPAHVASESTPAIQPTS
jgi:1-acyl-sn-glycerol-3-phosphate acyltransferase